MTVDEIMSRDLVCVELDDTLGTIRESFHRHHFHHVMVASGRRLLGVISDRDVLKRASPFLSTGAEQRRDAATLALPAHQVMTRRPITVTPETDVLEAARLMVERNISCLPVVDGDQCLVGVVTWKDLLRSVVHSRR